MDLSYGNICRKKRQKKADLGLTPFLWRAPTPGSSFGRITSFAYD